MRSFFAAMALVLLPFTSAHAQQSSDTARYVVLFSGRPAGEYREWWSDGALHSVYDYNDRGRGPHEESVLKLGDGGVPTSLSILGHGYLKDSVNEQFANSGGTATWKTSSEQGTRANASRAYYIPNAESPVGSQILVKAALANNGRVPLLPSGEATVEKSGDLTITANGKPVHVIRYDVDGLGFSPFPIWTDESGEHFATVSGWSSVVPVGWESGVPSMIEAQEKARGERYVRLARELSHKPNGALVIRGARLFVAERAAIQPAMTVVMNGDRITAVGKDGSVKIPAGATVIDAAGKTLLPGLWDMHVHIQPGDDGLLHIAAGVTNARDMGNDTITALDLQKRFADGSLIGPRLMLAGLIDGSGPYQVPTGLLADDKASVLRDVDWYAAHGYEQIKVYSSMKPELVPTIIAEAHAKGLRVSGHVPAYMTASQVVRLGFDEVQHANFLLLNFMDTVKDTRTMARFKAVGAAGKDLDLQSPQVREFVKLFKDRGTDIDPTLTTFEGMFTARPGQLDPNQAPIADRMPPQVQRSFYAGGLPVPEGMDQRYRDSFGQMKGIVKAMYDAGVPIVAGTDNGPVGFQLLRELELYVQAGIPAPQVLRIATIGAATVMHHEKDRGSIAVGKVADAVLVDGDPTANISDARKTVMVVKDGVRFDPKEIYAKMGVRP
ncbi:MAG TPA: amidohydrolase family protein [Gemmatimonadaceae bacterium]|jgi:imidazolonepropionase-like amidohydrolase